MRNEIDIKYTWRLEDIYPTINEWNVDFNKVKLLENNIIKYKNMLSNSSKTLAECLNAYSYLLALTDQIYMYAKMKKDEDNNNTFYRSLTDKAIRLYTEVASKVSFVASEILNIPKELLSTYISTNKELYKYKQFILEIIRCKNYSLSTEEEKLLSLLIDFSNTPKDIFSTFNNTGIKFDTIECENGDQIEISSGRYIKLLKSSNRKIREKVFHLFYKPYSIQKNTFATILISSIKKDNFFSNARKFNSSLEASLYRDNININVYNNLIETVNNNLHIFHRYVNLRKNLLAVDKLHMYDLYLPLVKYSHENIHYENAISLIKKALTPLGTEYISTINECFKSRWIDVLENQYKTSGAYSWCSYNTHPYILLNYQGTLNDVFTLAHEIGHSLHSLYTNKEQPYVNSKYKVFIGEIASTVNELLLINYMINSSTNKEEKKYILYFYLEKFRGLVFRQVMFSEFEKIIHTRIENNNTLTSETLCNIYHELNEKYFGKDIEIDNDIDLEWSMVPHFYNSFYVYKYATSFFAAISISEQILNNRDNSILKKYLEFLSSGNSINPTELLKHIGIDILSTDYIKDGLNLFNKILNDFENMVK
ncbi:oligoendopeptidase F [Clostridium botulinum]|uniref:Oligopeptidase F n=1 Tax=Clostridium botulinum TaxID=1491 RepID=A0A6M0SRX1_CLOBO|nr:oligoendopeptidase F [Clostridium botulinum]